MSTVQSPAPGHRLPSHKGCGDRVSVAQSKYPSHKCRSVTTPVPWCLVRTHYTAKEKTESSQHTVRAQPYSSVPLDSLHCSIRLGDRASSIRQSLLHLSTKGTLSPIQLRWIVSITSREWKLPQTVPPPSEWKAVIPVHQPSIRL